MSSLEDEFSGALAEAKRKFEGNDHDKNYQRFLTICQLLREAPTLNAGLTSKRRPKHLAEPQSAAYFSVLAEKYLRGRNAVPSFQVGRTLPDAAVSLVIEEALKVSADNVAKIVKLHAYCMCAENAIGKLLERFVAEKLESFESMPWVWCPGEIVKSFDFVCPPVNSETGWQVLQVKNRDNTESSAHGQTRQHSSENCGVEVLPKKWVRSMSKTGQTKWEDFPDTEARAELTEEKFLAYVRDWAKQVSQPK